MSRNRWVGGFAFLALTLSACGTGDDAGSPDADADAGGGNGHLVFAEDRSPRAAWALVTDDAYILSRAGCLEPLLQYESDGTLIDKLATSWEQVDPTTWEFQLREDVDFQDGTPMDADTVVGALTHVLEAETPARSFNSDVVSGVEAVSDMVVRITTKQPDVLLPYRMASPNTGILAPKAFEGAQLDIQGTCTGPFEVVEEVPELKLTLERNEDYWGGTPELATAEVRFVADDGTARATQLQTGEADIASVLPVVSLADFEGNDDVEVSVVDAPRTTAMMLNNSRPPFDDPLVRQAIQKAMDTEAIAASVYEGVMKPAVGPFSPDQPWAPEDASPVTQDLDEARRLFAKAGVDPSTLSFELMAYISRPEFGDLAAVIQDQLGELGIEVKIRSGEYASFEPDVLAGDYDAFLLSRGYLLDVGDPAGNLTADYTCGGSFNMAHYCDETTDAQIQQALQEEDQDVRYQVYAEVAERLHTEAVSVYLVHESLVVGTRARVENFEAHPLSFYTLTHDLGVG